MISCGEKALNWTISCGHTAALLIRSGIFSLLFSLSLSSTQVQSKHVMKSQSGMSCKHVAGNATDLLQQHQPEHSHSSFYNVLLHHFWNILCSLSLKTATDQHICHNNFNNNNRHYFLHSPISSETQRNQMKSIANIRHHLFVRLTEAAKHSEETEMARGKPFGQ